MARCLLVLMIPLLGTADDEMGSKTCAACHPAIYKQYSATSMAQSSGRVGDGPFRESFDESRISDSQSGAEYRVSLTAEGYRLEFRRESAGGQGEDDLRRVLR